MDDELLMTVHNNDGYGIDMQRIERIRELKAEVERLRDENTDLLAKNANMAEALLSASKELLEDIGPRFAKQTAQNAAMREIVEHVASFATIIETKPGVTWCAACRFVWGPDSHAVVDEMHADDCPVTKARAILAESE